ncbi:hypothetical protein EMCG_06241 [[Emmonsia] crescens]|uniref:RRM domain-containing protein n=1 Tax=[Emmonsia] crescens TaxID=73230 RepID=A0A0G2JBT3_9EURO|nr:hypothetical protein EMCG_06241 [Emmonsia crescens UAMH 3008]
MRSLRSKTTIPLEEPSAQKLFNDIRKVILNTNHSADLTFRNVPPSAGLQIATSFSEDSEIERALPRISYNPLTQVLTARVMPTTVHDCHQEWLSNELLDMVVARFLTIAERKELNLRVGTSTLSLPTVVVETGWSESWPRLDADKDLWLVGGASVELVLLIRWTKITGGRVKGDLYVHGKNPAGKVVLLQTESIFPAPTGNVNQVVPISRRRLFGTCIFPAIVTSGPPATVEGSTLRDRTDTPFSLLLLLLFHSIYDGEQNLIIFVFVYSYNVTAEELFDLFGKFGPIRQIRQGIAANSKGTAFVVYEDVVDAKQACDKLNGFNFQNRYLVVLYHQPEKMARSKEDLAARQENLERLKQQHGID